MVEITKTYSVSLSFDCLYIDGTLGVKARLKRGGTDDLESISYYHRGFPRSVRGSNVGAFNSQ